MSGGAVRGPAGDSVTVTFGPHGHVSDPDVIDLSIGLVKGIPELELLLDGLCIEEVLRGIGEYPGTQGPLRCLELLAELWRGERHTAVDPDQFVLTNGALDGLRHALAVLPLRAPVLYPVPGFSFGLAIDRAGMTRHPIQWEVGRPAESFVASVERLVARIDGPVGVIACFPANPSGRQATTQELERLRIAASRDGGVLILDDVYRFGRSEALERLDDVIVVDSVSKRLGLPGLRVGYVMCQPKDLFAVRQSMACTSVGVSTAAVSIAMHALAKYVSAPAVAESVQSELDRRRSVLSTRLRPVFGDRLIMEAGSIYGCLVLDHSSNESACQRELELQGLVTTPGSSLFASDDRLGHPPFLRFCLAADDRIERACEVLEDFAGRSILTLG